MCPFCYNNIIKYVLLLSANGQPPEVPVIGVDLDQACTQGSPQEGTHAISHLTSQLPLALIALHAFYFRSQQTATN